MCLCRNNFMLPKTSNDIKYVNNTLFSVCVCMCIEFAVNGFSFIVEYAAFFLAQVLDCDAVKCDGKFNTN